MSRNPYLYLFLMAAATYAVRVLRSPCSSGASPTPFCIPSYIMCPMSPSP